MNSFDVTRTCAPGDMLVTGTPSEGADPVLFSSPRVGRLSVSEAVLRSVPDNALALVVTRLQGYDDWALVLCDGTVGWINALSVHEKVTM